MTPPQPKPRREPKPGMPMPMRPSGFGRAPGTPEQAAVIQDLAHGVFIDMTNAGYSLREALAAIYLTGVKHAAEVTRDAP